MAIQQAHSKQHLSDISSQLQRFKATAADLDYARQQSDLLDISEAFLQDYLGKIVDPEVVEFTNLMVQASAVVGSVEDRVQGTALSEALQSQRQKVMAVLVDFFQSWVQFRIGAEARDVSSLDHCKAELESEIATYTNLSTDSPNRIPSPPATLTRCKSKLTVADELVQQSVEGLHTVLSASTEADATNKTSNHETPETTSKATTLTPLQYSQASSVVDRSSPASLRVAQKGKSTETHPGALAGFVEEARQLLRSFDAHMDNATKDDRHENQGADFQDPSSRRIALHDVARRWGILEGRWIFFVPRNALMPIWQKIEKGVLRGSLGHKAEAVSTDTTGQSYEVSVYTEEFDESTHYMRVINVLQRLKFGGSCEKPVANYEPVAYWLLGITSDNAWGLSTSLRTISLA